MRTASMALQRECACGGSASVEGACEKCKQPERNSLQRYSTTRADLAALTLRALTASAADPPLESASHRAQGHDLAHVAIHRTSSQTVQRKGTLGQPPDPYEQGGDDIAPHLTGANRSLTTTRPAAPVSRVAYPLIQRAALPGSSPGAAHAASAQPAQAAAEKPASQQAATRGLLVDDDADQIGPGQMRKTEFLDQLETAVCAAADEELARAGRTAQGCPYIGKWIGYYRARTSQHIERALLHYAPEAAGAKTARDYLTIVSERTRRAAGVWATTGKITGVPEELAGQLGGGGLLSAAGGLLSGIAGAVTGAVGAAGRAIGGLFTKAKEGGSNQAADPESVRSQLNAGQSLEGTARSRMERAFGHDFSNVKVHADSRAAELSAGLNARAFTIGSDIAFGAGEYRPGTLIGDALLAHELAHVVQQAGSPTSSTSLKGMGESDSLEDDADRAAVSAVIATRGAGAAAPGERIPRLRTSLSLRRCGATSTKARTPEPMEDPGVLFDPGGWNPGCVLDVLCPKDEPVVKDLQNLTVKAANSITDTKWDFVNGAWKSKLVHPSGMNQPDSKLVVIKRSKPCTEAAETLFHEVRHQRQPPEIRQSSFKMEMDAYIETEKWEILRGLPEPQSRKKSFRKKDPASGATVPDEDAIREFVIAHYGGPDAGGEEVVGHKEPDQSEVKQADGSKKFRQSREGDSYLEFNPTLDNEDTVPKTAWECPTTAPK